ncbi:hypothetical protein SESBI_29685 [Sesbania bispinosa]|nr:hypothetical protein SESBI_29685 [Sesbania bispinosa]
MTNWGFWTGLRWVGRRSTLHQPHNTPCLRTQKAFNGWTERLSTRLAGIARIKVLSSYSITSRLSKSVMKVNWNWFSPGRITAFAPMGIIGINSLFPYSFCALVVTHPVSLTTSVPHALTESLTPHPHGLLFLVLSSPARR